MEIRKEINGCYELADMVWSGAVDTIADIQNANKENEFMTFLEMIFCDDVPTDTEVNDFIWFERDYIYKNIGLTENGELPEDEMEEDINESLESLENEEEFDDFCDDCDKWDKCRKAKMAMNHYLKIIRIKLLLLMILKRCLKKKLT